MRMCPGLNINDALGRGVPRSVMDRHVSVTKNQYALQGIYHASIPGCQTPSETWAQVPISPGGSLAQQNFKSQTGPKHFNFVQVRSASPIKFPDRRGEGGLA